VRHNLSMWIRLRSSSPAQWCIQVLVRYMCKRRLLACGRC
jgi:hypothetical protein